MQCGTAFEIINPLEACAYGAKQDAEKPDLNPEAV
jgi:hypothetical protein